MHTQNVNIKTAAAESTERWDENRLARTISEQKSLLTYLEALKNRRLRACEKDELVLGTLMRMAENVLFPGVVDWRAETLRVHFNVAQPWLQARTLVERFFGDAGKDAWEHARKHIADSMAAEPHMP